MRYPLFAVLVILMACTGRNPQLTEEPKKDTASIESAVKDTITAASSIEPQPAPDTVAATSETKKAVVDRFKVFAGKVVYGDFDGNGVIDTLSEHLMKMNKRRFIKSVPDLNYNLWESVVEYCQRNDIGSLLITSGVTADTLYSSLSLGTQVMLNVGDVNKDGADDVAFVWNLLDFSNLTSCGVYSLCSGQWKEVRAFQINEKSFSWSRGDRKDSIAAHSQIRNSLEKRNGVWKYKDYMEWFNAETEAEANKMHVLKAKRCDQ